MYNSHFLVQKQKTKTAAKLIQANSLNIQRHTQYIKAEHPIDNKNLEVEVLG